MNLREKREEVEHKILFRSATFSDESKGRQRTEEECEIRTCFQRDRDRILHSKAFRRLKHKTQVFISPEADHFRTRLTHTLEVSQIGRTIARALDLNEDLVEAMALGHDLGHTPFGHSGEYVLNKLNPKGFKHNEQSLRVIDYLAGSDNKIGLNLTYEVREGILNHTGDKVSSTLEGRILKYADRIAYINHDIDDAIRANILNKRDLPKDLICILGDTHSKRINTMISSIVKNSYHKDFIKMENNVESATMKLRAFMFDKVYLDKTVKSEDDKIEHLITTLYEYYLKNFDKIAKENLKVYEKFTHTKEDIICDYIAGMTDIYAIKLYKSIYIPRTWK